MQKKKMGNWKMKERVGELKNEKERGRNSSTKEKVGRTRNASERQGTEEILWLNWTAKGKDRDGNKKKIRNWKTRNVKIRN